MAFSLSNILGSRGSRRNRGGRKSGLSRITQGISRFLRKKSR